MREQRPQRREPLPRPLPLDQIQGVAHLREIRGRELRGQHVGRRPFGHRGRAALGVQPVAVNAVLDGRGCIPTCSRQASDVQRPIVTRLMAAVPRNPRCRPGRNRKPFVARPSSTAPTPSATRLTTMSIAFLIEMRLRRSDRQIRAVRRSPCRPRTAAPGRTRWSPARSRTPAPGRSARCRRPARAGAARIAADTPQVRSTRPVMSSCTRKLTTPVTKLNVP